MVDSLFPGILSDIALEVFLNNVLTFNQYINLHNKVKVSENILSKEYLKYKLYTFIHQLLYSNISSNKVYSGEILTDRVFCLKNKTGEIEFYSIFEQNKLQQLLMEKMRLEINLDFSTILKENVKLSLKIFV